MKFVLLPSAKDDLAGIRQYLQQESPAAACSVAARIKQSLLLLTEQPYIGHPTDDDEVLEWHRDCPIRCHTGLSITKSKFCESFMKRNAGQNPGLIVRWFPWERHACWLVSFRMNTPDTAQNQCLFLAM